MPRAQGPFDVSLTPQPPDDFADGAVLGRLTIEKTFRGDLVAASRGQMLTGMTVVNGSAAYVAIERVTGTLHGRRGAFILQHRGVMDRGAQELTVTVVPDSATDELAGLIGSMRIIIQGRDHAYAFDYELPDADAVVDGAADTDATDATGTP
jgi:hypothetical protein